MTVTLADPHDALTLAGLVLEQGSIAAVPTMVGRLHVTAEVAAIDLHDLADAMPLHLSRHSLPELVGEHEGRFVLNVQLARESEG